MRKFTLFLMSLFLTVGAMAQITNVNQLSNGKCYHITSRDGNRGAFYTKPGEGYLSHCGGTYGNYLNKDVKKDATSTAQQFAFVEYDGKLYLYSVSEKKFAEKDGNFIKLVKTTTDFVTVTPNGSYFNININGTNKLNFSGGYDYGVYANYQNDDDGNNLVITEAGDFNPTAAIRQLLGLEDDSTFGWNTTTLWEDVAVEDYSSVVFNNNALGYGIKCIEGEVTVGGARTATVTFAYTSGNCALNVRGVEVVDAAGYVVAGDYHVGKAGSPSTNNVYTVKVAEAGTYTVRCYATFGANDRANATNGTITISFDSAAAADFKHNVSFATEYATMHLGYKVAIPNGVEAYIVSSIENGYAIMAEVEGVIPAATPVILKNVGSVGSYDFTYSADKADAIDENLLEGSIVDRYVLENAYVLGIKDNKPGFYLAEMNQLSATAFKNNANKAYLPASAVPVTAQGAANFSFRFEDGTTAIENVEVENEVKAIYDLTGRRVEEIAAPGIYIVNGKKVLVK